MLNSIILLLEVSLFEKQELSFDIFNSFKKSKNISFHYEDGNTTFTKFLNSCLLSSLSLDNLKKST